jgi:hypothetical protein
MPLCAATTQQHSQLVTKSKTLSHGGWDMWQAFDEEGNMLPMTNNKTLKSL